MKSVYTSFLKTETRWHAWQVLNKISQSRYLYSDTRKRCTHCDETGQETTLP